MNVQLSFSVLFHSISILHIYSINLYHTHTFFEYNFSSPSMQKNLRETLQLLFFQILSQILPCLINVQYRNHKST